MMQGSNVVAALCADPAVLTCVASVLPIGSPFFAPRIHELPYWEYFGFLVPMLLMVVGHVCINAGNVIFEERLCSHLCALFCYLFLAILSVTVVFMGRVSHDLQVCRNFHGYGWCDSADAVVFGVILSIPWVLTAVLLIVCLGLGCGLRPPVVPASIKRIVAQLSLLF